MGEDARWVCNTCKTICYRGGTPAIQHGAIESRQEVTTLKEELRHLMESLRIEDCDDKMQFLDDLYTWLGVHEGHNILIGSDYSTDNMDLDNYRVESIDGVTHELTIIEEQEQGYKDAGAEALEFIMQAIEEYADNKEGMSSKTVAKDIIKHCSGVVILG